MLDAQKQEARVRGDSDLHFVGHDKPRAAFPVLLGNEHSQVVTQPFLLYISKHGI